MARDFLFVFKSNVAYLFIFRQFQSCSLPDWQQRKKQTKKQFYSALYSFFMIQVYTQHRAVNKSITKQTRQTRQKRPLNKKGAATVLRRPYCVRVFAIRNRARGFYFPKNMKYDAERRK